MKFLDDGFISGGLQQYITGVQRHKNSKTNILLCMTSENVLGVIHCTRMPLDIYAVGSQGRAYDFIQNLLTMGILVTAQRFVQVNSACIHIHLMTEKVENNKNKK